MNSKKIFKIIISIIILALVVAAIIIAKRYIVISQIVNRYTEIDNMNNYSFVVKRISKDSQNVEDVIECKHKDNITTVTYQDRMFWYDANTNENISCSLNDLTATTGTGDLLLFESLKHPFSTDNTFLNKLKLSLSYYIHINSVKVEGEKCYTLNTNTISTIYYYKASDKTILKWETSPLDNVYEWSFGSVSDEDVARPNLEGYDIK